MTCEEAGCHICFLTTDRRLTREELRAWLDRKPPKPPPDERSWEEFELERTESP